jgi:hypothetical protein
MNDRTQTRSTSIPTATPRVPGSLDERLNNSILLQFNEDALTGPLVTVNWDAVVQPHELSYDHYSSGASTPYSDVSSPYYYSSGPPTPLGSFGGSSSMYNDGSHSGRSTPLRSYSNSGMNTPRSGTISPSIGYAHNDNEVYGVTFDMVFGAKVVLDMPEDEFLNIVSMFHEQVMLTLHLPTNEKMNSRMRVMMCERRKDAISVVKSMLETSSDQLEDRAQRNKHAEEQDLKAYLIQHQTMCVLEARTSMRRDEETLLRKNFQKVKIGGTKQPEGVTKRKNQTKPRELPKEVSTILKVR